MMGFVILSKTEKFKVTQCQTFDEDFFPVPPSSVAIIFNTTINKGLFLKNNIVFNVNYNNFNLTLKYSNS